MEPVRIKVKLNSAPFLFFVGLVNRVGKSGDLGVAFKQGLKNVASVRNDASAAPAAGVVNLALFPSDALLCRLAAIGAGNI